MDRRARWTAVIVFVYNLAVVISGIFAADTLGEIDRIEMFLLGGALAIGWTVYFMFAMRERLEEGFFEPDAEDSDADRDVDADAESS